MSSSFPPLIKRWNHKTRFGIKFIDTCARRNNEIFGHSKEAENNSLIRRVRKKNCIAMLTRDVISHFDQPHFWQSQIGFYVLPVPPASSSPHNTNATGHDRFSFFFSALWSFQMHSSFRIQRTVRPSVHSTVCVCGHQTVPLGRRCTNNNCAKFITRNKNNTRQPPMQFVSSSSSGWKTKCRLCD